MHGQLPQPYGTRLQICPSSLPHFCMFCALVLPVIGQSGKGLCEVFLGLHCRLCSVGLLITHLPLFVPVLWFQMLGEASPVTIVLKLNQLISLLSSIEEKVEFSSYFISSCSPLSLVCFLFIISTVLCHS